MSASWANRPFLCIDTETTGVDRQRLEDYFRRNVDQHAHVVAGWPIPVEVER